MLYSAFRSFMFSLDPETAHHLTLNLAKLSPVLGKISGIPREEKFSFHLGSVRWTFPIGLAAGLDKNAEALSFFEAQGFGALECGTVTLRAQEGNPRPRIFRYKDEESLRNAMGFPNRGLQDILPRIKNYQGQVPLGINMGKNKESSTQKSIEELSTLFEKMGPYADYFVINVSSPNTPGLRALQEKEYLSELFAELTSKSIKKDLFLKIAPDLSPEKILELKKLAVEYQLTGIIATNTTIMADKGEGGISGKLLAQRSKEVRSLLLQEKTELEIIAAGGIFSPQDLFEFWAQGGKAGQVYTSYIYRGPALLKNFHRSINSFLTLQGMNLEEFFSLPIKERQLRLKEYHP
jgi:dihydroorotate dehydrogenase